jgi:hypothetical protein
MKKIKRVLSASLVALITCSLGGPALASAPAYESRLSTSVSSSETGSGASRVVTYVFGVSDTSASLLNFNTQSSPTGSQVKLFGAILVACNSARSLTSESGWNGSVSDCQFINSSENTVGSGSGASVTYTIGHNATNLQVIESSPFVTVAFNFEDANGTRLTMYSILQGSSTSPASSETPTPAKYSGPEFSGLSAKGIMAGTSPRLEGKNLDEISSIEIGGKAATFTLDGDKALDLTLPEGLAPGLYDLVINSPSGKLTHINAIQVREPRRAFSITTRSEGRISEAQYQEHAIISSMQIPELNKARCIVNGPNLAQAKAQAERLCALVAAANPNIETTVVEARSTVRNSAVFARVTYGWN